MIIFLTFIYFKIIQIPFFFANSIHLKSLVLIGLKKILLIQFYPLLPFLKIIIPFFIIVYFDFNLKQKIHSNIF